MQRHKIQPEPFHSLEEINLCFLCLKFLGAQIKYVMFYFQTSVTIEIRYQPMDGTVGVWSDGEFLDIPDDRDGMFAFETDSLLSGQSPGSGTSPARSLQGSIPTFRKWVKRKHYLWQHDSLKNIIQPLNINLKTRWSIVNVHFSC